MDDVMQALAQPRRREILELVRAHELTAGDIATHFEVTRPAISQHLKVLRECRLVTERRQGTRRYYRARPEGLADLRKFLELFWDYRLGLLKDAAESDRRKSTGAIADPDAHQNTRKEKGDRDSDVS